MAVIAFPNLAPQGATTPRMSWGQRTISARQKSPMGAGVATTLERPGSEWTASLPYENLGDGYNDARRARLQSFAMSCRGYASRFYVPLYGWTRRGSFPATELLTNNYFASGTTGWSAGSEYSLTAADGMLRARRTAVTAINNALSQNVSLTEYTPYVARALTLAGSGTFSSIGPQLVGLASNVGSYGLRSVAAVPLSTGAVSFAVIDAQSSAIMAGDYFGVSYASVSRCAMVDNGPNLLLRSDEIDNGSWVRTGLTSVSANAATDPRGTTTADVIVENGSTSGHYVTQTVTVSSAAADYSLCVAVVAGGGRNFCWLGMDEGGASSVAQYFSLAGGGAVGASGTTGAGWSNRRAFTVNLGNGWVLCCLVARKTTSATSLACNMGAATADGTNSYLGGSGSSVGFWRATLAQSSVPTRLSQTTSTASTGSSQAGGGLYLKGLPASTDGLLLPGDPVEIMSPSGSSQMVRARSALNSDSAQMGYFEFEAPIRVSPSDGAAVAVHNPLCRMMLDSPNVEWSEHSGGFSDTEFSCIEDTYP